MQCNCHTVTLCGKHVRSGQVVLASTIRMSASPSNDVERQDTHTPRARPRRPLIDVGEVLGPDGP